MNILFDFCTENESVAMPSPHSHDHYELYFLLDGERNVFVESKMFHVEKNSFVIIPPFTMHKTEGGPFKRVNIIASPSLLTDNEIAFLTNSYKKTAFKINKAVLDTVLKILTDVGETALNSPIDKNMYMLSTLHVILLLLSKYDNPPILPIGTTHGGNDSFDALKVVQYLNQNYMHQITLCDLCNEFYMSQTTLCKKFRNVMYISIMDYLLEIRIKHAKELLFKTCAPIDVIAQDCGFSSTNYFRNVFKKSLGMSPLQYRKSSY